MISYVNDNYVTLTLNMMCYVITSHYNDVIIYISNYCTMCYQGSFLCIVFFFHFFIIFLILSYQIVYYKVIRRQRECVQGVF